MKRPMDAIWLVLFLSLTNLGWTRAYPNGAPTGACEDMMPRHMGVQPQTSPPPYTLDHSWTRLQRVLLEARNPGDTTALGTWQMPPPDTRFLECSGNPQGAVTHANTNLKGNSTVYSWIPPDTVTPVYFMATVAQQRTVYWLNVQSSALFRGTYEGNCDKSNHKSNHLLSAGGQRSKATTAGDCVTNKIRADNK
uniref:Si:dkey-251i10.2 n=1 Tax=Neogobius melanostomus TaxID=47308 RepID=A0A8C6WRN0_9GOBI